MKTATATNKFLAAAGISASFIAFPLVEIQTVSADPGQNCTSQWNTMYSIPVGVRTTCYKPDGSYRVCSSLGTDGNGPGTCFEYPAPPQMGGQPVFNPPVPGVPPPPPPPDQ
jgi:hypothetical protein